MRNEIVERRNENGEIKITMLRRCTKNT